MPTYAQQYDEVQSYVQSKNWNGLNGWLIANAVVPVTKGDVVSLITLLTLTLPVKSKLFNRASVYKATSDLLGERADKVLKGLE